MEKDASVTAEQMAEMIGISPRAVEKHIANLKSKGIIDRVGPDKGGHWEVIK